MQYVFGVWSGKLTCKNWSESGKLSLLGCHFPRKLTTFGTLNLPYHNLHQYLLKGHAASNSWTKLQKSYWTQFFHIPRKYCDLWHFQYESSSRWQWYITMWSLRSAIWLCPHSDCIDFSAPLPYTDMEVLILTFKNKFGKNTMWVCDCQVWFRPIHGEHIQITLVNYTIMVTRLMIPNSHTLQLLLHHNSNQW